jgi:exosortase
LKATQQWDLLALVIPVLGVLPLLILQAAHMWEKPHLQFFPIAIGLVGWLAYRQIPTEENLAGGYRLCISLAIGLLSFIIAAIAIWLYSPWLAYVTLVTTFLSWSLTRLSETTWTRIFVMAAVLVSTVPLPLNQDRKLVAELQNLSSKACSNALDGLGIPNLLQGNILQIEGHSLFVEEACSGVTSLYSLVSLGLILALVNFRSFTPGALTVLLTPFLALMTNLIRLLAIALGFQWWNIDLSKGFAHNLLGLSVFLLGAVCLVAADVFISTLLATIPKRKSDRSLFRRFYNAVVGWPGVAFAEPKTSEDEINTVGDIKSSPRTFASFRFSSWIPYVAIAYSVLMVPAAIATFNEYRMNEQMFGNPTVAEDVAAKFPGENDLPIEIGERWQRVGYRTEKRETHNMNGEYSHVWVFRKGERSIVLSLDFAFRGWHNLQTCYVMAGWQESSNEVGRRHEDEPWPWLEVGLVNELGLRGQLWYSLFEEKGKPYLSDMSGPEFQRRMDRNLWKFWSRRANAIFPVTYQYQLFIESGSSLKEDELKELRQLFLETREIVRQKSLPTLETLRR